jgi:hypothetical protein
VSSSLIGYLKLSRLTLQEVENFLRRSLVIALLVLDDLAIKQVLSQQGKAVTKFTFSQLIGV